MYRSPRKVRRTLSRQRAPVMVAGAPPALATPVANATWATKRTRPATFVLVHGAWHGGWAWKKLTPLLQAAGHTVFTPTLTGLGERVHLLAPDVDLDTHIEDVALVLEYEELNEVVLVGHSYGGMVLAGLSARASERLARLVYLDAFVPEDGKAVRDYAPLAPARMDGWRVPPPGTARDFGVADEDDFAWAQPRLGDQPLKTFTQPVRMADDRHRALPKTFIRSSEAPWFVEAGERAKQAGYDYHDLLTAGHNAMITQPRQLADLLLGLA